MVMRPARPWRRIKTSSFAASSIAILLTFPRD
jgi:hypothetical protein